LDKRLQVARRSKHASPFTTPMETIMEPTTAALRAAMVRLEHVPTIKPFGLDVKVLLPTDTTGGIISVPMVWHKPGEGPPRHVHCGQEEIFFIVDGTYELTVGDRTAIVGPGTIVFILRRVVHRFKNVGGATARMLDWSLPGGQDHYFKAIAELAAGDEFTGERAVEISKKFDTNFPAAQRHARRPW
jgi:mannose-6-phosphate isomerase-like protein (cupin superfamily)